MPHHMHTPPQCGFWTGHDPSCFDQGFGAEKDCVLIEVGKNKGNYLCIHERSPETGSGRMGFSYASPNPIARAMGEEHAQVTESTRFRLLSEFTRELSAALAEEYGEINRLLRGLVTDELPPK
jgi:hypothetical protein